MKKFVFLIAAAVALIAAAPLARAHDYDSWTYAARELRNLEPRMEAVDAKRDMWGASPQMRDQIVELHERLAALHDHVRHHTGNPRVAREKADQLDALMAQVEDEYQEHIRGYENEERGPRSWRDW
jgi:uncharacterized protein YciW